LERALSFFLLLFFLIEMILLLLESSVGEGCGFGCSIWTFSHTPPEREEKEKKVSWGVCGSKGKMSFGDRSDSSSVCKSLVEFFFFFFRLFLFVRLS